MIVFQFPTESSQMTVKVSVENVYFKIKITFNNYSDRASSLVSSDTSIIASLSMVRRDARLRTNARAATASRYLTLKWKLRGCGAAVYASATTRAVARNASSLIARAARRVLSDCQVALVLRESETDVFTKPITSAIRGQVGLVIHESCILCSLIRLMREKSFEFVVRWLYGCFAFPHYL